MIIILLLGLYLSLTESVVTDWCEVQDMYCGGAEHIACTPNSFTKDKTCMNIEEITMTTARKNYIVKLHNHYRNIMASGKNIRFPSASAMKKMKWDTELQYLAKIHASYCNFAHDDCHSTPTFPDSGQNLYTTSYDYQNTNITQQIEIAIKSWYDEWKIADYSILSAYESYHTDAGHFSVMSKDTNAEVGCGMISYEYYEGKVKWFGYLFTCDYGRTNIFGEKMYKVGFPCSKCNSCSTVYTSLCL